MKNILKINFILRKVLNTSYYEEPSKEELIELEEQGYTVFLRTTYFIILKDYKDKYYGVLFQRYVMKKCNYLDNIIINIYSDDIFEIKKLEKYSIKDTYSIASLFKYMENSLVYKEFNENHLFLVESSLFYLDINDQDLSYDVNPQDKCLFNLGLNKNRNYRNGIDAIDEYLKKKFYFKEEK